MIREDSGALPQTPLRKIFPKSSPRPRKNFRNWVWIGMEVRLTIKVSRFQSMQKRKTMARCFRSEQRHLSGAGTMYQFIILHPLRFVKSKNTV